MDEVVPMSLRRVTLDAAKQCASTGVGVYMIISTVDVHGQRVDCERLLLPFGRDGTGVEQLLASLQLTLVAARRRILKEFEMQADVVFSGLIRPGAAVRQSDIAASNRAPGTKLAAGGGDNRKAPRRAVKRAAKISFGGTSRTCMVRDISASGASIEDANLALVPDNFRLVMEMETAERRCTVVWRKPTRIGVRFS
jgi:hypothetical protein